MSVSFTPHPGPPPRRLLIRGVNWLGDAVMTTPALMRLREALGETHITLLTRAKLAELWQAHPAIDEILTIEPGVSVWTVGGRLRAHRFDTALLFPNSPRSALEVWLSRIPRRIGYQRPWRNWLLTQTVPNRPGHVEMRKRGVSEIRRLVQDPASPRAPVPRRDASPAAASHAAWPSAAHQMHEYLHLGTTLGASGEPCPPVLRVHDNEVEAARRRFALRADGLWLGLNAGAEYGPAKRWPAERFVTAARAIQEQTGCGWVLFGGPADVPLANDIAGQLLDRHRPRNAPQPGVLSVAGQTSLRELMALLQQCRVLLTNDTGPMHVAAALGVPVVVPFGSTSPELTGPGLPGDPRHRLIQTNVACSPCFLRQCPIDFRCMGGIRVEQMVDAVLQTLRDSENPPRQNTNG